ncbi:Dynein light chain 1, cytoplasmic [Dirofilaria immitis]
MAETGEEITLLPYDYDVSNDRSNSIGTKESEKVEADNGTDNAEKLAENTDQVKSDAEEHFLPDDQIEEGDKTTLPDDKPEQFREQFENDYGEQEKPHEHDIPPSADQQSESVEPEEPLQPEPVEPKEPLQPERSETSVLPYPEPSFQSPNVDQPSFPLPNPFEIPCQPEPGSKLPEPYYPKPAPTLMKSEVCQIISTGMNAEMQQYASSLATQAFAQFPNHLMAIARHIMINFEEKYEPPWCCIVSNGQLGFYLRYDRQNHIYFSLFKHTIFLYKESIS